MKEKQLYGVYLDLKQVQTLTLSISRLWS